MLTRTRRTAVAIVSAASLLIGGAMVPAHAATGTDAIHEVDDLQVEIVENSSEKLVIESGDGDVIEENLLEGTITIDIQGEEEIVLDRDELIADTQFERTQHFGQNKLLLAKNDEEQFRKWLCDAAVRATVRGHGAAWLRALKIISRLNPTSAFLTIASHRGAEYFLRTQC